MNFSDFEIFPGVVTNADDKECYGKIKCTIAGHNNNIDPEDFYWCAPFISFGYQRVSKPRVGQTVWIIHNKENIMEYYWMPRWELNGNTAIAACEDDYDVLVSRPGADTGAQLFYTDSQGFVQRINEDISSTMTDRGIRETDSFAEINLENGNIDIGAVGGGYEPAVKGQALTDVLNAIVNKLEDLSERCANSWTTNHVSPELLKCSEIKELIPKIVSDSVRVN